MDWSSDTKRFLFLCGILFGVIYGDSGLEDASQGLQWTQDIVRCPQGVVVLEEVLYPIPSPRVCDARCRTGPEATLQDECYFRNGACVQRARDEEVAKLYETCTPTYAPSGCNISQADWPMALNVGYSCLNGAMFDPYNRTFSWKANKVILALLDDIYTPTALFTRCQIVADATKPSVKITALKSPYPQNDDATNVTSYLDDITVVVDGVRTSVAESGFPHWWIVKKPRFQIEFLLQVTNTEVDLHPHWLSLEEDDLIEVVCRRADATLQSMTSAKPTDMVIAVVCTVVVLVILVLTVVLILRCRRRTVRNYSNLESRVEFVNTRADSYVIGPASSITDFSLQGAFPLTDSSSSISGAASHAGGAGTSSSGRTGGVGGENPYPASSVFPRYTSSVSNETYSVSSETAASASAAIAAPADASKTSSQAIKKRGRAGSDSDCGMYVRPRPIVVHSPETKRDEESLSGGGGGRGGEGCGGEGGGGEGGGGDRDAIGGGSDGGVDSFNICGGEGDSFNGHGDEGDSFDVRDGEVEGALGVCGDGSVKAEGRWGWPGTEDEGWPVCQSSYYAEIPHTAIAEHRV